MGCGGSKDTYGQLTDGRFKVSIIELSIATRPGGADVGPVVKNTGKMSLLSEKSNPEYSDNVEIEAEPAADEETTTTRKPPFIVFEVDKVVPDEDGVMIYHFIGTNASDTIQVAKRFSDFKTLHFEISKLMANERNVPIAQRHLFETYPALPDLPNSNALTYLRGSSNEKVLDQRELQFAKILNAISRHPVAFRSQTFTIFLEN